MSELLSYAPPARPAPSVPPDPEGEPELVAGAHAAFGVVLRAVRRRWLLVLAVPFLAAVLESAYILTRPRTYSVSTTFMPEGRRGGGGSGGLAGLAAQLGAAGLVGDGASSPAFYLDLLRSPAVLGRVVDATYTDSAGQRSTYARINHVGGRTPAEVRVNALDDLNKRMGTALSPKTGVLKVTVGSKSPVFSRQLADTLLASLNDFNLVRRQSQASAERRFVERRLSEARVELRAAEERLEEFLSRNRVYQTSPELLLRRERLDRDVILRQGVLTTLAQSYEQARIDEVRDTPVITIIEAPETPAVPDRRKPFAPLAFAVLIGGALGVLGAVLLERRAVTARRPRR